MDDILKNQEKILKEQATEIKRLKTLLGIDEGYKKVKELEAEKAKYEELIKEKEAKLLQQKQMVEFQQAILTELGLSELCVDVAAI